MSAAKAKGTRWETDLVRSLSAFFGGQYGLAPRRVAQEGFLDTGDLHGLGPFVAQAKDWRSWEAAMREGLDGAEAQSIRAGTDYGVAFVKRARRAPGGGYAVVTVATFARLLLRLRRAESLLFEADSDRALRHSAESSRERAEAFPRASSAV